MPFQWRNILANFWDIKFFDMPGYLGNIGGCLIGVFSGDEGRSETMEQIFVAGMLPRAFDWCTANLPEVYKSLST